MTPKPTDTLAPFDLDAATQAIKEVMDNLPEPRIHTGCFGPSPTDSWRSLELAGLRAEVAELRERVAELEKRPSEHYHAHDGRVVPQ